MKKVLLGIAMLAMIVGCTKYASQEQLDELQAREDAVTSLKEEVKDMQTEKASLIDEKADKEATIEELETEISNLEKGL
ncbi:hypothetical protein KAW18_14100 [candidate division WOR-3 bacterium]|nr:hypothetical protein [candidate division WOR-3 bacterium]MCK4528501.1 hypothetical protein [candidate division WOR-3 bacterium]